MKCSASIKAIGFLQILKVREGPKASEPIKLAPFQKKFVRGALADGINVAVLSIGSGNAKTALSAGIALGAVMGKCDKQPRREILIAARTRDQDRLCFKAEHAPLLRLEQIAFRGADMTDTPRGQAFVGIEPILSTTNLGGWFVGYFSTRAPTI